MLPLVRMEDSQKAAKGIYLKTLPGISTSGSKPLVEKSASLQRKS